MNNTLIYLLLMGLLIILVSLNSIIIYIHIDNKRFKKQLVLIHIERCLKILRASRNSNNINNIHHNIDESIKLLEFILENNKRKDEKNDEKEELNN